MHAHTATPTTRRRAKRPTMEPLNVSVDDAAAMLGVGRVCLYELLNSGQIASLKIGSRRLVPVAELEAFNSRRAVRSPQQAN